MTRMILALALLAAPASAQSGKPFIIADQIAGTTPAGPASVPASLVIRGSTAAPHPSARKR